MSVEKYEWAGSLLSWILALAVLTALAPPLGASDDKAIAVRLLVPSPMACHGQQVIELEAVLTNLSEKSVELSQDGVVHSISIEKYEKAKSIGSTGWLLDIQPGHWIKIDPHQSVVVPFTEPITDKLFGTAGLFSVQIDFGVLLKNPELYSIFPGSAPSNKALFFLSDCKSDPSAASTFQSPSGGGSGQQGNTLLHESGHVDPSKSR